MHSILREQSGPISGRLVLFLFFVSLFSFIYLKHTLNESNPANRVALCLALWEDRSVVIDKYYQFSVDICYRDGHYYSDKAPGVSFLAYPLIGAAYEVLHALGRTDLTSFDPNIPGEPNVNYKALMLVGSLVVSIVCAGAVAVMYCLLRMLGASQRAAAGGALLLGFATSFGPWSTVMFGHAAAGAFLLFGTALGICLSGYDKRENKGGVTTSFLWIVTGFLLAYAVWTEYTAPIPACILACVFLAMMIRRGDSAGRIVTNTLLLGFGAVLVAAVFFYHNALAYGSPWKVGYNYPSPEFPGLGDDFYGIGLPNLRVLILTLFHPRHGVLWFSPFLILSPFFALHNIRRNRYPALNVACILIPAYYFLLNSGFAYWATTYLSARHTTASLPFLVIPIALAWKSLGVAARRCTMLLCAWGFVAYLFALNVPASEDLAYSDFKLGFVAREFFQGHIRNLLYYAGVDPYCSLAVILAFWLAAALCLWRMLARMPDDSVA